MPSARPTAFALPALSPLIISAAPGSVAMALGGRGLERVAESEQVQQPPAAIGPRAASHDSVGLGLQRLPRAASALARDAEFVHQPCAAEAAARGPPPPAMPRSGQGADRWRSAAARFGFASTAAASGCSLPDCSVTLRRVRPAVAVQAGIGRGSAPARRGWPFGERAGLVEGHHAHRMRYFERLRVPMRMPRRHAAPVPTMIAAGVANPSAQGGDHQHRHRIEHAGGPVAREQAPGQQREQRDAPTTGTKTALTWSTGALDGRLAACADSTSRTMRASVDSAPTACVRTSSSPSALGARRR